MLSLRYALRSLAKSKGFVLVAVLALGIGLGLSTTMFAVLDAVINPYSAYRDPNQLFYVSSWLGRRQPMTRTDLYRLIRDETRSFESVVPVSNERAFLEYGGTRSEIYMLRVPPRYFDVVGARPSRGRPFTRSDGEDVALLGHNLARRLFGTRRSLDGLTVTLHGQPRSVVGVMPRGANDDGAFLPLPGWVEQSGASVTGLRPLVRVRAGVTREQADEELKTLARLLTDRLGARDQPVGLDLLPIVWRREEVRDIHKAMVGSALAVLLIACVNLAHLMLARGLSKRRELALRMAVGASRAAVVRQMFLECALVTAGGTAIGALVAVWGADVLRNQPREVSWVGLVQPQLSWRVFALATVAAALSAVLFGLLPAIRVAMDVNLDEPLKDDTGTTTGRVRHRYNALVVAEVALALVLMMGGGLLLRTVQQLQREALGFDARTLFRVYLNTDDRRDTTLAARARHREALTTAAGVEGVREVAYESSRPARGGAVTAEMVGGDSTRAIPMLRYQVVSSEYLRVLGLPILRGRDFEPGDAEGPGVAIVDPIAAQWLYPRQDPVGHMLKLGGPANEAPWVRIIGVVRSPFLQEAASRYAPPPSVFVVQSIASLEELLIRTATREPRTVATLLARLRALPGVLGASVWPYDYAREGELASRGFLAKVFVGMGAVALGLAALGLYGVLAYAVGRRMREFAVRLALGAEPRQLLRMVMHDGLVMLLAGIGAGAFVALAASRLLDAVLVAVLPSDVTSLVLCEVVLLVVGLAAALGPARRAMRADPMAILRAV